MQEIFNFVCENWQLITSSIVLIVSFILALTRKKPITSIYAELYEVAIFGINEAERSPLKGSEKLAYAVSHACEKLRNIYPGLDVSKYMTIIGLLIEYILTTPQKKGE